MSSSKKMFSNENGNSLIEKRTFLKENDFR
jgi:hypothetical protein